MPVDRLRAIARCSLLILAVGAAGHLWHHLTDSDCESPLRGGHPCVTCAAFHGGVLAGSGEVTIAPPPSVPPRFSFLATDPLSAYETSVGPTRGPPTA